MKQTTKIARLGEHPGLLVYEGGLTRLEFHPIANAFPLMEGDAFRELVKDVRKNGQQQPILTYQGKILDGRNRYRACLEAGEEPWTEPWLGKSPVEAVLSLNLHRRHLSSSQKSAAAAELMPHLKAEARKRQQEHGNTAPGRVKTLPEFMPEVSTAGTSQTESRTEREAAAQAAKAVGGTNPKYIREAARLKEEEPETFEKVKRGEVGLSPFVNPKKPEPAPKFEPSEPLQGEDRRAVGETLAGQDFELPPWDLPPERKEYGNVVKNLVRLAKLDPEIVASHCKGEYEAGRDLEHVRALLDWFGRYEAALEKKRREYRPGNLRAVEGGRG